MFQKHVVLAHWAFHRRPDLYSETSNGSSDSDKEKYSKVVTKNGWGPKKNNGKSNTSKRKVPILRSSAAVDFREVYIQELDFSQFDTREEFEESVVNFCKSYGVHPVDASMIPVKGCGVKAGCKLTVKAEDYDQVFCVEFWPEGTEVRDWVTKV